MRPTFAIIGCGRIASRHAEQMVKLGDLVAVCDTNLENARELAARYGARVYDAHEDLLRNEHQVDVVAVCTPNGLHARHSIDALGAGKNVLCEKPLCTSAIDARIMIDAANQSGAHLFVVKQNRYNPPVVAVKKLLSEDKLGNILSFQINGFWNRPPAYYANTWKGSKELDGGSLYTQFSHFIDLLYWFLGDVKSVKSITRNFEHPLIETEDTGMAIIEMLGGAVGTLNYTVNSFLKNMEGSFTIFGEKGTVKIGGEYLNELEYQCLDEENILSLPEGKPANAYGFYRGSMSNHDLVYENLVRALNEPGHEFASALEGMKTVEIIEKIYNAAVST